MKIDHPDRIAEMVVCRDCQDVVGPFWRLYGALEGKGPLFQRGRCSTHLPRPDAPTWPRFDFNRAVDLSRSWCRASSMPRRPRSSPRACSPTGTTWS